MTKPSLPRSNRPALALHVPEPAYRPGDTPDFSAIHVPAAGSAPRPDVAAHLAFSTSMSSAEAIAMLDSVAAGAPVRGAGSVNGAVLA